MGTVSGTAENPGIIGFTYGMRVIILSNGNLRYGLDNGVDAFNTYDLSDRNYLNEQVWHIVQWSSINQTSSLYIDGELMDGPRSIPWSGSTRYPTNFIDIGRDQNNPNLYFTGSIGHFKFYDRGLSEEELNQNYRAHRARYLRESTVIPLPTQSVVTPEEVPLSNLVRYWTFNGTTTEEIVNSNATISGSNTGYIDGYFNNALDLQGTNTFASASDDTDISFGDGSTDSAFSVTGMFKLDTIAGDLDYIIDKSGAGYEWRVYVDGTDENLTFRIYSQGGSGNYIGIEGPVGEIDAGTWYHFGVTYDGSGTEAGMSMYVTGSEAVTSTSSTGTYVAMENDANNVWFGTFGQFPNSYVPDGQLQNISIWDKELSAGEYLGIYNEEFITGSYLTGSGLDISTQQYIATASIVDTNEIDALNYLVTELKNNDFWYTDKATVYPFLGGTSGSMKYNLYDPRDADDAHRLEYLTEGTGWEFTFNEKGMFTSASSDTDGAIAFTHYYIDEDWGAEAVMSGSLSGSIHIAQNLNLLPYSGSNRGRVLSSMWNGDGAAVVQSAFYNADSQVSFYHRMGNAGTNTPDPANGRFARFDGQGIYQAFISGSGASREKVGYSNRIRVQDPQAVTEFYADTGNPKGLAISSLHNGTNPPSSGASFYGPNHSTQRVCFYALLPGEMEEGEAQTLHDIISEYNMRLHRNPGMTEDFVTDIFSQSLDDFAGAYWSPTSSQSPDSGSGGDWATTGGGTYTLESGSSNVLVGDYSIRYSGSTETDEITTQFARDTISVDDVLVLRGYRKQITAGATKTSQTITLYDGTRGISRYILEGLTDDLVSNDTQARGTFSMTNYTRTNNVVFKMLVYFPTASSDACILEKGGSGQGTWIGVRDTGTTPTFRARSGNGGQSPPYEGDGASSTSACVFVDTTDFPTDGGYHTVIWEVQTDPGRGRLWIDGDLKGESFVSGGFSIESGQWEGGADGIFIEGTGTVNVTGEPTTQWGDDPEDRSYIQLYDNQLISTGSTLDTNWKYFEIEHKVGVVDSTLQLEIRGDGEYIVDGLELYKK